RKEQRPCSRQARAGCKKHDFQGCSGTLLAPYERQYHSARTPVGRTRGQGPRRFVERIADVGRGRIFENAESSPLVGSKPGRTLLRVASKNYRLRRRPVGSLRETAGRKTCNEWDQSRSSQNRRKPRCGASCPR